MVDLVVPVSAPGASTAAQQIQQTATAAERLTTADDRLTIAQKKAAQAAKEQEIADKRAAEAIKKRTEAVKRAGAAMGGATGGILSRIGGSLGAFGIGGGIAAGVMAAGTIAMGLMDKASERAAESMLWLSSTAKAAGDAMAAVRSATAKESLSAAEKAMGPTAKLLAMGYSQSELSLAGPDALDDLLKLGKRGIGRVGAAASASAATSGMIPIGEMLATRRSDTEGMLSKALGVSRSDLPGALERLSSAPGGMLAAGIESRNREMRAGSLAQDESRVNVAIGERRIAEDEYAQMVMKRAEAEKVLLEQLIARAEQENWFQRMMRASWLGGGESAQGALSRGLNTVASDKGLR